MLKSFGFIILLLFFTNAYAQMSVDQVGFRYQATLGKQAHLNSALTPITDFSKEFHVISFDLDILNPQDSIKPNEAYKVSITIPPGTLEANAGAIATMDGQEPSTRPSFGVVEGNPSVLCSTDYAGCPSTGAFLEYPPFNVSNAGFTASLYDSGEVALQEKQVSLIFYQGPKATYSFSLFSALTVYFTISDAKAYNEWLGFANSPDQFNMNVTISGAEGNVSAVDSTFVCTTSDVNCTRKFEENSVIQLVAQGVDGATEFVGWSDDCSESTTATTLPITMNSDKSCTAEFKSVALSTINVQKQGSGSILYSGKDICTPNCTKVVQRGSSSILTAQASDGYDFIEWQGDAACSPSNTSPSITIFTGELATINCTAVFKEKLTLVNQSSISLPVSLYKDSLLTSSTTVSLQTTIRLDETDTGEPIFFSSPLISEDIEAGILTFNMVAKPENSTQSIDLFMLASWSNDAGVTIIKQKVAPQGSFDFNDSSVWKTYSDAEEVTQENPLGISFYKENIALSTSSFSTNVGAGKVIAPLELGTGTGRNVTFLLGYKPSNEPSYLVGMVIFTNLPDKLLNSAYSLTKGGEISIPSEEGIENLSTCSFGEIAVTGINVTPTAIAGSNPIRSACVVTATQDATVGSYNLTVKVNNNSYITTVNVTE